jgi:hypothetical protein
MSVSYHCRSDVYPCNRAGADNRVYIIRHSGKERAMREIMWVISFVALMWALPAANAATDWHSYVYATDGFSVSAPTQLKYAATTVDTKGGKVESHQYTISDPDRTYIVSVATYPPNTQLSLDAAVNGGVNAFQGKITAKRAVSLGGITGIDCDVTGSDWDGHFRAYLSGERLYQLITIWHKDKPPIDFNRFDNSFHFVKR